MFLGINSMTRSIICPDDVTERQVVLSAYYITIPRDTLKDDADIQSLLDTTDFCPGPGQFLITGNLPHAGIFFMLFFTEKLRGEAGVWDRTAKIEDVEKEFSSFHETYLKALRHASDKDCLVWRASDLPTLPTWRSPSGKVLILGDAAHAILPTGAQGAAMAVEDSAALVECIGRATHQSDIPKVLEAFETIRKPRTDFMQRFARSRKAMFCMPDGPDQEKRDSMMKVLFQPEWNGEPINDPPALGTPLQEHYVRSYDVIKDVRFTSFCKLLILIIFQTNLKLNDILFHAPNSELKF